MATVYGRAIIEVDVDGRNIVRQLRRVGGRGGTTAGESFNRTFSRAVAKGLKDRIPAFSKTFDGFTKVVERQSKAWGDLSHNTRQWTLIIGTVAAAFPTLGTLAGTAAGGVMILAGAFTSVGIGLGVTIAAFSRFTGDIENVPDDVRPAREAFDRLKDALSDLNGQLTSRVFKDTEKAWDSLRDTVLKLEKPLGEVADVVNGLIQDFAENLKPGTDNFRNLSDVIENAAGHFDTLARSAGIVGGALLTAFANDEMQDAIEGLVGWVHDLATGFDDWVNSPGYGEFIGNTAETFENIGGLIESLGTALSGLFDQQSFDNMNTFIDGLSRFLEGPGKDIIDLLDALNIPTVVVDTLNLLGDALSPLVRAITDLAEANPDAVRGVLTAAAAGFLALAGGPVTAGIVISSFIHWFQFIALPQIVKAMQDAGIDILGFFKSIEEGWANLTNWFMVEVPAFFVTLWANFVRGLNRIGDEVSTWWNGIWEQFGRGWDRLMRESSHFWRDLGASVRNGIDTVGRYFGAIVTVIVAPFINAYNTVSYWVGRIIDKINELLGKVNGGAMAGINSAFGGGRSASGGSFATGGILLGPRRILAGEAGPEAIVPLNRSLSLVDPSVRALSAYAQGISGYGAGYPSSGAASGMNLTQNIYQNGDPRRVALAVVDRLAERVVG